MEREETVGLAPSLPLRAAAFAVPGSSPAARLAMKWIASTSRSNCGSPWRLRTNRTPSAMREVAR